VQRVYSVANAGGLTVVEVENDSPLPIAVAFDRGDILSVRPPTTMPIEGIDLPAGSVVFPVGHHSTLAVAVSHTSDGAGTLPQGLPTALQVARGWETMVDRAGRFVVPDDALVADVTGVRCELALAGPVHPDGDPIGYLLGVGQLVRMGQMTWTGQDGEGWLPDVAQAVERAVRTARRGGAGWELGAALDAADVVFHAVADSRAAGDLAALRRRLSVSQELPMAPPDVTDGFAGAGVRLIAWLERHLADGRGHLLPQGFPATWLGATVEAYQLPVGGTARVSFAIRWHGARPAVLWEVTAGHAVLSAPVVAPDWSTEAASGEALWPAPEGADQAFVMVGEAADPAHRVSDDSPRIVAQTPRDLPTDGPSFN
jgi:hypothetical protein